MTAGSYRALGVDVGTSSLKAVCVSVQGGRVVVECGQSVPYASSRGPNRDPDAWVQAAIAAVDGVADGPLEAVGFTGQMHALVPVSSGRPLGEASLWLDVDGGPQLEAFARAHPDLPILERTANVPLPDFTLAKWLLYREGSSDQAARVDALPQAKDYVRAAFMAEAIAVTDTNEAGGTQWYDPFGLKWDEGITAAAAIPREALPLVVAPATVVGRTGGGHLPAGVPVVAGAGDQLAAAFAHGGLAPGRASLSLGTSGVLSSPLTLDQLPEGWDGALHLFPADAAGGFQVISTIPALAGSLRWAADLLGVGIDELARLAETAATRGSENVRFFPYLAGSGAPHPDVTRRGQLRGLAEATDRADVARAVLSGVASELACQVAEMRSHGVAVDEVIVSGGLAALEPLVCRFAELVDVPVSRSLSDQGSALGAALLALKGTGNASQIRVPTAPVNRRAGSQREVDSRWQADRDELLAAPGG